MIAFEFTDHKSIFAGASIILSVIGFIPYFRSILAGVTKPHIFTWAIWSITMAIAFAAQINAGASFGAYHTGFSALLCIFICLLAFKYGEKEITRADFIYLTIALLAIPIWIITDTALYAILIVLVIDILGFLPTIRKSIHKPDEENALAYFIASASFAMAVMAIGTYSVTTAIYPIGIMLMNIALPAFLIIQRRRLASHIEKN
jgi:hypothetical protein